MQDDQAAKLTTIVVNYHDIYSDAHTAGAEAAKSQAKGDHSALGSGGEEMGPGVLVRRLLNTQHHVAAHVRCCSQARERTR
eukprot:3024121-Pleurochrysis_carterae.AAC.1